MKPLYCLPALALLLGACSESVHDARQVGQYPTISPDYVGVTIPVNIAPLNFTVANDSVLLVDAVVTAPNGATLHGQGKAGTCFDETGWRQLLSEAKGDSLSVTVSAKYADGWRTYERFGLYVSPDSIDYGVTYRLIEPGYEVWSKMGIYERCLSDYRQRALIENTQFEGCVNCHSTSRANPSNWTLHIRGAHGATLLNLDGQLKAYDTKTPFTAGNCVYPYWHPGGRYLAYSTNNTRQSFHTADPKRVEVFDEGSDLQIYDTHTNQLILTPQLKRDSVFETFPVFSADGKTLYFCEAHFPDGPLFDPKEIRYNLCSIAFDPEKATFGPKIDTLILAEKDGKSISFPRPSYDGRYLCFALSDYGQFSIWHKESDLYLLDLNADCLSHLSVDADAIWPMEQANSPDADSFHNWSSNSRWMVFSSRRDDGWFTRLYFTHVDESGKSSKPFLLPQSEPVSYYGNLFLSYNAPEFVVAPSSFDSHQAAELINREERTAFETRN